MDSSDTSANHFPYLVDALVALLIVGLAFLLLCRPQSAFGGAAYIPETANPGDTGYAGAGLAARASDAGTIYANPAGMTRFETPTTMLGFGFVYLDAPFNPNAGTTVAGENGDTSGFVPGASFAHIRPLSENLKLGISMQNAFGLALDWGDQWVGRYVTTKTTLIAPQLQPTIAYRVNDWLSIGAGAGLTLGYLEDRGRINNQAFGAPDGKFKFRDNDLAVQGNFGIMIEPFEGTRIGLRYLTETDLDFEDKIEFSNANPLLNLTPEIDLGMKMPQSLLLGVYHRLNDEWALLGSVGWDHWSRFARINIEVGSIVDTTVDADFDDTWHFGIGAEYQYSPNLMLTAGFSYDSSMSDSTTRPINIPLGSMYRYGLGFKYRQSDDMTLGGGLSFMWEGDLPIKTAGNAENGFITGQYDQVSLTFLSFYVQWR